MYHRLFLKSSKKRFLITLSFIACFLAASISSSAQIRVLNEEKKWIILMPNGSWHYEDAEAKKTETSPAATNTPTEPIVKTSVQVAAASEKDSLPAAPKGMEYRTILVDGIEKQILVETKKAEKTQAVAEKVELKQVPTRDTLPPPNMEYKTISVDGVEKQILVQKNPNFENLGTPIPPPDSTLTKKGVAEVREGDEFLTPDEEYRLKAAATQAGTKQDENVKPEKVKNPKKGKPEKPEKVVAKPIKKPRPAAAGCELVTNEIDEFTGKEKKATKTRPFFTFTPDAAKKYMRAEDYLTCSGYLARVGSYKTLNLIITIDSPYGQAEYGEIAPNSSLLIRMIDGSTVELYCDKGDVGRVDKIKNQTTYSVFYILEPSFEAQLKRGEVSRARLVWSAGSEDYELYNLDFFTEQLNCIN